MNRKKKNRTIARVEESEIQGEMSIFLYVAGKIIMYKKVKIQGTEQIIKSERFLRGQGRMESECG